MCKIAHTSEEYECGFSLDSLVKLGGDKIYNFYDDQLRTALWKLLFYGHPSLQNVRKVVSESAELAAQEGRSAAALAACRTLAEELTEMRRATLRQDSSAEKLQIRLAFSTYLWIAVSI
ncbi:hypothetical protein Tco_0232092 [Tanacetum coccineum]